MGIEKWEGLEGRLQKEIRNFLVEEQIYVILIMLMVSQVYTDMYIYVYLSICIRPNISTCIF